MANEGFSPDDVRPAIWILVTEPAPEENIEYILWGLEEEGIQAEIRKVRSGPAEVIAKQAADSSHLNVGIGVDGNEQVVVLHHRDLPGETPLFSLEAEDFQSVQLRRLGANAARLAKGNPLLFRDDHVHRVEPEREDRLQKDQIEISARPIQEQLVELISGIVSEILNNIENRGSP